MLTQRLETHVDLFDPVPLSLVPPGHSHGLLLRDGVAEAVEAQAPFAAQELRRTGALSLQHLGFALEAAGSGGSVGVRGGDRAVRRRGVQAEAGASFSKSKGECSLRGGDGCSLHLADSSSKVMDATGRAQSLRVGQEERKGLTADSSRVFRVGTVWLTLVQVSLDCLLHEPI